MEKSLLSKKIKKILTYSYEKVPYYHGLFQEKNIDVNSMDIIEEFKKIPVLRKINILEQNERMITEGMKIEKLYVERTSGSTGEPICIYKSGSDKIHLGKEIWAIRKNEYGINPSDTYCSFHMILRDQDNNSYVPPLVVSDHSVSISLLHLNDENMKSIYEALDEKKVKWIYGMPSALFYIAEYIKRNGLKPLNSIKYIELSGEYRTNVMKKMIEEAFDCPVADFYGLRECYGAAISCKKDKLHCVENNVYLEILDDEGNEVPDGENGKIYVTSFNNKAMPLIRYETGDIGRINRNVKCECGKCGDVLELSETRSVEYIVFKDGRRINSAICYCALSQVNTVYGEVISQFQIIQKGYEDFLVRIKRMDDTDIEMDRIIPVFEKSVVEFGMPKVNWMYEEVDHIDSSLTSGKLKYFIREDFE